MKKATYTIKRNENGRGYYIVLESKNLNGTITNLPITEVDFPTAKLAWHVIGVMNEEIIRFENMNGLK